MESISGSRCPLMTPLLGSQPQIAVEGTGNDGVVVNTVSPHDGGRVQQSTRALNANRRIGEASVSLRRSSNGRFMSEQSLAVRETAAEHLEERQSDWAYSRPVVVLDLLWNLIFVVVAGVVLVIARTEKPSTPLRVWVGGYALQCALHMLFVGTEYRRRQQRAGSAIRGGARGGSRGSSRAAGTGARRRDGFENADNVRATRDGHSDSDSSWDSDSDADDVTDGASCAKRMESANTMFSFAWWILGFYWLTLNADTRSVAPTLYWLVVVFLAFDVFFVVFCIALACVIGIAVCCCLPCIIAILYAVADPEGASEDDIGSLPLYNYRPARDGLCVPERGLQRPSKGTMVPIGNGGLERDISVEDAECCICLSAYEDGVELRGLPCLHHFHSACIDKWLRAKATCPLCKYNIVRNGNAAEEP